MIMKEKEFGSDYVINSEIEMANNKSKDNSYYKKENLYLDSFKNERKILEYALIFHTSLNFTFWLNDKYKGNIFDCPTKTKKVVTAFAIMLLGVTFVEDFIYILFRKDKNDKMLSKLMKYEKSLCHNVKNSCSKLFSGIHKSNHANKKNFQDPNYSEKKSISNEKEKRMMKIHSELREIEKVENELREKIKNIPIQDLSHLEILSKINQNNERKKKIIKEFKEYNKNLNNIQMI